ncbi:MAG TPA: hypothetical protein VEB86_02780 [Chryseosolibacter sp.]|nr:hypothetical protein [Chryseosolibacter sp.]
MKDRDVASEKDQRQEAQHPVDEGSHSSPAASGRYQGSSGRSREDEDLENISSQTDSSEDGNIETLQQEEVSGSSEDTIESANYSDTDEDEDEGLGDGNLGRTVRG